MKLLITTLITFTLCANTYSQGVVVSTLTNTHNDITFSSAGFDNVIALSDGERGLSKINAISSTNVTFSATANWQPGTWGQGYYTRITPVDTFIHQLTSGEYWSCHPLIRTTSGMSRSHIHAEHLTGDSDNLPMIKAAVDYLIDVQRFDGSFIYWHYRPGKLIPNIDETLWDNTSDIYPTSHGLRTLAESYLYLIDTPNAYRIADLRQAIIRAADWLEAKPSYGNSNYHGFAAWALSGAYKVTRDCRYLDKATVICTNLINSQDKSGTSTNGMWHTGGIDTYNINGSPWEVHHDNAIWYHWIILRGMIETFDITPNTMMSFKMCLLDAVKRGVNNVIDYRMNSIDSRMFSFLVDVCGNPIPQTSDNMYTERSVSIQSIGALAYYSKYHPGFTLQEQDDLKNMLNKLAKVLDPFSTTQTQSHFAGIAHYSDFLNDINNNLTNPLLHGPYSGYDANKISSRVVSGDFDRDGREDDVATFYDYGNGETRIHVWKANGGICQYQGANGWWKATGYTADKIKGRVISGDFDRDGYKDDLAAFYDYGNGQTRIHVWTSNGGSFQYQGANGWWNVSGYTADKVTGRVISGDFDRDGYEDDIAAFYDYGNGQTRIHVWKSTGSSFQYQSSTGWWNVTGYTAGQITDRVISGDFDRDGKKDDIAAFYDYGNGQTRIHVWKSNGSSFQYQGANGWWKVNGYTAGQITGRVVAADFDRDGKQDDIAAYYDYGNGETRIHVWKSQGNSFQYQGANGWWKVTGYTADQITGRVVSGDFDTDGKKDDIAAFYDYGNAETRIHLWESTGNSLQYQGANGCWTECGGTNPPGCNETTCGYYAPKITGRVISGDFDRDGREDDLAAFYDYGNGETRIHVWKSNGSKFQYQGADGWWKVTGYTAGKITDRVVSGDFDRDGFKDDIAAFYDYGNGQTRIHVWKSNGSSFQYQGANGWWNVTGYAADEITGRVVSGDFDRDGKHDDIAAFYDYGGGQTRIHVWESSGGSFQYQGANGWWNVTGYTADEVTGRVVSGDFDRDGKQDDIAAFYDYGGGETRIHVWESNGGGFQYQGANGWWNITGYTADEITGRVVSGDFDNDGKQDDIAAFYDYNCNQTRIHVWKSAGGSFQYQSPMGWWNTYGYDADKVTGRVVSGSFDLFGSSDDIAAFYEYKDGETRIHVWSSTGSALLYQGAGEWWEECSTLIEAQSGSQCTQTIEMTDNTTVATWSNQTHVVEGTIQVATGTTLNIFNSTVKFAYGASIVVEAGGKLNIMGSELKSCTDGGTWKGIEVRGQSNEQHTSNFQGKVDVKNSTIQDAETGIFLGERDQVTSAVVLSGSGGIAKVTNNTKMRNNGYHIYIAEYNGKNLQTVIRNSEFDQTNVSSEYVDPQHIYVSGTKELAISNNVFTGGNNGLVINGSEKTTINSNQFSNVQQAVKASGCEEISISNNVFSGGILAVSLEGCDGYLIDGNLFESYDISIEAINSTSGSKDSKIRENRFELPEIAIKLKSGDYSRLDIICNEFVNYRKYAIKSENAIVKDQGTKQEGSGNKFVSNSSLQYDCWNHTGSNFKYLYDPLDAQAFTKINIMSPTVDKAPAMKDRNCMVPLAKMNNSNDSIGTSSEDSIENENGISEQNTMVIYPNPNNGAFTLMMISENKLVKTFIYLYNTLGEVLYEDENVGGHVIGFDISDQPKGVYFIKVISGNDVYLDKIIYQ